MLPEPFLGGENLPTLFALTISMYKLYMLLQHCLVLKWRVAEFTPSVPVGVSDVHGDLAKGHELNSALTTCVARCHLGEHMCPLLALHEFLQHRVCGVKRMRHVAGWLHLAQAALLDRQQRQAG